MSFYKNNLEHLLDELHRIDLIIKLRVKKWPAESQSNFEDFRGLFVSEDDVNDFLQTTPFQFNMDVQTRLEQEKIDTLTYENNKKKYDSLDNGKELRLNVLSELFKLKPFEIDVLLICLASELDLRFEILYSYLQNDITKKRPCVDLVINLIYSSIEERLMAREYFSHKSPLLENRLIYLSGDKISPLLSRSIKVDGRIINFLMGNDEIDQNIHDFIKIIEPEKSFEDLILPEDTKNLLDNLIKRLSGKKIPMLFLHGPNGTGKKMTAETICLELKKPLIIVNSTSLKGAESFELLKFVIREAKLQQSAIYMEGFDVLFEKDAGVSIINIIRELDNFSDWIFLSGELPPDLKWIIENHIFANIDIPLPSFSHRKKLWETFLNGDTCEDIEISELASKFKFSGGQIRNAIFIARSIAMAKNSECLKLSTQDIYIGCSSQSNKNLSSFARKIEPLYTWDDIVLTTDIMAHLKEISSHIKHKGTVYTDWGFDKNLSLGKGLNVLFSGPSGTGKTMAAEIIARDAGLDLYKIDLSCVVSKYIGETEKNLNSIFKEAQTSSSILFFDEADALFGKRSEVSDSHDRYANIETNYLLQKMEEHEGIAILATNLRRNMDEAFSRRIHIVVEFPFPDKEYRNDIWKKAFPIDAPIGNDVDFYILSHELKLSGGNIKNIALAAAFYAAEDGKVIRMHHIMQAARREYQKLGRTWTEFQDSEKAVPV